MSLVEHCIAAKAKSQNDRAELSKKKNHMLKIFRRL